MAEHHNRKKVLVISYYWPPSGGSGVQRWLKLVKYLHEYGWEPVVYTPENPEYPAIDESFIKDILPEQRVVKKPIWEPYGFYKKLVGLKKDDRINVGFLKEKKKSRFTESISVWLRGNIFIPDARRFWIRPSIKFLTNLCRSEHFDAIITTGPPHSMHLIGLGVSKATGIPWLADFCDPWTGIDFYDQLKLTALADKRHHRLEKRVLENADAVSVVTPNMLEEFQQIHSRNYNVVLNGFDAADIKDIKPSELDEKFSIGHIGSLVPSRNPHVLWKALSSIVAETPEFAKDLEIKLVGKVDFSVLEDIELSGLTGNLHKDDYLPHQDAIRESQSSQVLLLLINRTQNARGILTGKLFEYLASRRPILCIGPTDGDAAEILQKSQAGKVCDYEDVEACKQLVMDYYQKFKNGELFIPANSIELYTWKHLASDVSDILKEMVSHKEKAVRR
ncbi:MAG: glycosyl transferase family 1 [Bacteroidales bacterium]|nr:glycosyl transferase family 1 [Bacteroidales bacterium]